MTAITIPSVYATETNDDHALLRKCVNNSNVEIFLAHGNNTVLDISQLKKAIEILERA